MFWCPFSSRFGFVALLSITISFQTFSSFLDSLRNPQWQKMSKTILTFIFDFVQFFPVQNQPVTCTMDGQRAIPQGQQPQE
jgi:hypothetical protein